MRSVLGLLPLVLAGCLAGRLDSNSRPSVMPMLSELPGDAEKRDGILNQSHERARPEHRRALTKKQQKAETTAAVLAAYIGQAFSKTQNVTLGVVSDIDENHLFEKPKRAPTAKTSNGDDKAKAGEAEEARASDLTPWIRFDQKAEQKTTTIEAESDR